MKSRRTVILLAVASTALVTGCGSSRVLSTRNSSSSSQNAGPTTVSVTPPNSVPESAEPNDTSAEGLPPVIRVSFTVPVLWDNISTLAPLPANAEISVTEDQALAAANQFGYFADSAVRSEATVLLGLLSDYTDGIDKPTYFPAYVIIGGKAECAVGGPPMVTHPATVPCVAAMSVNAQTGSLGKYSLAQNPPPLPPLD